MQGLDPDTNFNQVAAVRFNAEIVSFSRRTYSGIDLEKLRGRHLARWIAIKLWQGLMNLGATRDYSVEYPERIFTYSHSHKATVTNAVRDAIRCASADDPISDFAFIMGNADFMDLLDENPDFGRMVIMADLLSDEGHAGYRPEFKIPVHVVPGMKGVVCVPKVIIEKHIEVTS